MPTSARVDQLRRDPHAIGHATDAALQDTTNAQLASDRSDVNVLSLVSESRIARDDEKTAELRQISEYIVGDTIREIILLRVARHIGKRQHRDRRSFGGWLFAGDLLYPRIGCVAGPPFPDMDPPIDVLHANLASVGENRVNAAVNALVHN